jgi:hypothetical protein
MNVSLALVWILGLHVSKSVANWNKGVVCDLVFIF